MWQPLQYVIGMVIVLFSYVHVNSRSHGGVDNEYDPDYDCDYDYDYDHDCDYDYADDHDHD